MGSSPGFGSNPSNTPGLVETPPLTLARLPRPARRIGPLEDLDLGQQLRLRPVAPCSDSLSLRLRNCYPLTQLLRLTRRLILQKARSQPDGVGPPTACRFTVSGLFHSPPGVLFTFPSRYWFTIGGQGCLALEGGPPGFPQDFTCPVVLNDTPEALSLSPTGLSPSTVVLSRCVRLERGFVTSCSLLRLKQVCVTTPSRHRASAR